MNINNNMISLLNNKLNNITPLSLVSGSIITGEVIEVADDTITFKLSNGEIIQGKNESNLTYNKGDMQNFVISDIDENKISIKIAPNNFSFLDEGKTQVNNAKNEIQLTTSKELLIELMAKLEVPVTEKTIKTIESTKNYYGKLADLITSNNIKNISEFSKTEVTELVKMLMLDEDDKSISHKEYQSTNNNVVSHTNEQNNINLTPILTMLKNVSHEDLVFMLKTSLDFNLSNLNKFNSVFLGRDTIVKNLNDLISILESKEIHVKQLNNILVLLDNFSKFLENPKKADIKNFYNSILKELDIINSSLRNTSDSKSISSKIENIKTSLDFLNKVNENVTFLQVPILINKSLQNCEIMVQKEKNGKEKFDKNNAKLSISLNTKTFDLVRILIEIENKNIFLSIKSKSDKFKNIVSKNEAILSNKLKNIGYNNVFFRYSGKNTDNNITIFSELQDSIKNTKIDVRV